MIPVEGGIYTLGRDNGPASEAPAHTVQLQGFRIDRTEVTNAAFAEYLNALAIPVAAQFEGGNATRDHLSDESAALLMEEQRSSGLYPIIALDDPQARIGYSDGAFRPTPGYENHPVTETTWAGARAYCAWRGTRLPSEAEWEAAARGADASLYPWGNTAPDQSRVFVSGQTGVTAEVGSRPAGATPSGVLDMSGSLAEWTSSLKRPYPYDPADGREAPDRAGERVTRGGDYIYDAGSATLTATHRDGFSNAPGRGHRHIGFRCVANAMAG
ncbi:formylglycine-generating enzyme family protein [Roseovarius sp. SCSIO 43702]|uniref:formylglycine-generating enzyme family protein n=1 Tax=Roseovarius sp. SCSIO 43702 TaxID=2823043 RepID=UPI001C7347BA|nr:SUMF1/EgtB/PvdO family nonheme iron enzyme [Roseovarius sp. SCSIO 43702]QYX57585.1 formylglycine-generating enzyme family protein [Roseovarius sp. SCSIO 43702]